MEDIRKITNYLEYAKNLETEAYTQRKILSELKERIAGLRTEERELKAPREPYLENISSIGISSFVKELINKAIILGALYGIWVLYILFTPNLTTTFKATLYAVIAIAIAGGWAFINSSKVVKTYSDNNNTNKGNYEKALIRHKGEVEKEKERAIKASKEKEFLHKQSGEILSALRNTEDALRKFYGVGIIYPKYLNMPAVTQILEYFMSGRCNTLTGPDGAYNLYESEIRMNQIADNLEVIIRELEEIKQAQYMIYQEIKKGNEIASEILHSIDYACNTLDYIAAQSAVTAYNSEITAYNTSTLVRYELI